MPVDEYEIRRMDVIARKKVKMINATTLARNRPG
jgi:hypothetical protein